jgi:hypothetical protein
MLSSSRGSRGRARPLPSADSTTSSESSRASPIPACRRPAGSLSLARELEPRVPRRRRSPRCARTSDDRASVPGHRNRRVREAPSPWPWRRCAGEPAGSSAPSACRSPRGARESCRLRVGMLECANTVRIEQPKPVARDQRHRTLAAVDFASYRRLRTAVDIGPRLKITVSRFDSVPGHSSSSHGRIRKRLRSSGTRREQNLVDHGAGHPMPRR